ncbi:MAG: hypothetical protein CM15mP1_3990 [Methanobacteriota archaeon]|nr:MAG: hypothetical protein CM15mP1_3990 [Euryarchaeota archaeon]
MSTCESDSCLCNWWQRLSSPEGDLEHESALVLAKVMSDVIDLLEAGWKVILTHGNGPQVGHLMSLDASLPMDEWVAIHKA